MQLDLSGSFFALFDLPEQFPIHYEQLVSRYRELQKELHPDKHAAKSEVERRWSLQAASFVNDGYQTLSMDLSRAIYLLQLNGISIDEESDTSMDPVFLMQQMELRETLEAAEASEDPFSALNSVRSELKMALAEMAGNFAKEAEQLQWGEARTSVRQWQFLDKLSREAKHLEERLDD